MKRRGKHQKGAQRHAEGTHGERTRDAIREKFNAGSPGEQVAQVDPGSPEPDSAGVGRHRIHEDREQHDEAEKNSEKNRLQRDIDMRGASDVRERSS